MNRDTTDLPEPIDFLMGLEDALRNKASLNRFTLDGMIFDNGDWLRRFLVGPGAPRKVTLSRVKIAGGWPQNQPQNQTPCAPSRLQVLDIEVFRESDEWVYSLLSDCTIMQPLKELHLEAWPVSRYYNPKPDITRLVEKVCAVLERERLTHFSFKRRNTDPSSGNGFIGDLHPLSRALAVNTQLESLAIHFGHFEDSDLACLRDTLERHNQTVVVEDLSIYDSSSSEWMFSPFWSRYEDVDDVDDVFDRTTNARGISFLSALNKFGRKVATNPETSKTKFVELIATADSVRGLPSFNTWDMRPCVWATRNSAKPLELSYYSRANGARQK